MKFQSHTTSILFETSVIWTQMPIGISCSGFSGGLTCAQEKRGWNRFINEPSGGFYNDTNHLAGGAAVELCNLLCHGSFTRANSATYGTPLTAGGTPPSASGLGRRGGGEENDAAQLLVVCSLCALLGGKLPAYMLAIPQVKSEQATMGHSNQ
ncbi:hypothetical protein EYF80_018296 [Liparis tanakae]|uniref:Uncharacterized protein n=1 Tax=Liparis tanakae TaxID=230148 RepID=A0A4Z2I2J8_9TELE|nr:hypothetical protein EYF80_018296 [Liparis tanakae]